MTYKFGDRVTYENSMGNVRQVVIKDEEQKIKYINNIDTYKNILEIERPKYEVVKEKKELLNDNEREFLKDICKYYNNATEIEFFKGYLLMFETNDKTTIIMNLNYPENMKFKNVKKGKTYKLKELGLEEN